MSQSEFNQFIRKQVAACNSVKRILNNAEDTELFDNIEDKESPEVWEKIKCYAYLFKGRKRRDQEFISQSAQQLSLEIHWDKSLKNVFLAIQMIRRL